MLACTDIIKDCAILVITIIMACAAEAIDLSNSPVVNTRTPAPALKASSTHSPTAPQARHANTAGQPAVKDLQAAANQTSSAQNVNPRMGEPAQQAADQKPEQRSAATHSSKTQGSKAVTVSSEGASAIDITGEVLARLHVRVSPC